MNPYQTHPNPNRSTAATSAVDHKGPRPRGKPRAAAIAVLLALFGIVASLTATGAAAQRVNKSPQAIEIPEPPVVQVPRETLSATLEVKCLSATQGQVVSVVTNHTSTTREVMLKWEDNPLGGFDYDADTSRAFVDPGAKVALWANFPDGHGAVFTTSPVNDFVNVLAGPLLHTFDCAPKRAQPEPNATADFVCPHPGAAELIVKLGNTGSAPAVFDINIVSTGNQTPAPQPGITIVAAGGSDEIRFDVEHESFYSVDVLLEGAVPVLHASYTVDCPDPHDPTPDPTPEPPKPPPPGGGGGKAATPRFTG